MQGVTITTHLRYIWQGFLLPRLIYRSWAVVFLVEVCYNARGVCLGSRLRAPEGGMFTYGADGDVGRESGVQVILGNGGSTPLVSTMEYKNKKLEIGDWVCYSKDYYSDVVWKIKAFNIRPV